MNRKQAAEFLQVSEKTVSRAVASGRLQAARLPDGQLDVSLEELERFKAETETPQPVEPKPKAETGRDIASLVRVSPVLSRPQNDGLTLESLARAVVMIGAQLDAGHGVTGHGVTGQDKTTVPTSEKLTLSLEEAASLSGFSSRRLRTAIADGTLKGRLIGRGWKLRPSDLTAWVNSQFDQDEHGNQT